MLKAILVVVFLLVALCYAAFFITWNGDAKANLVTWGLGNPLWVPGIPVAFLPIAGAVIGVLVMAVAAWGPWAGQRRVARDAEAKLQKAIEKFNEQKGRLAERNEEIQRLQGRVTELEAPPVGVAVTAEPGADPEVPAAAAWETGPSDGL